MPITEQMQEMQRMLVEAERLQEDLLKKYESEGEKKEIRSTISYKDISRVKQRIAMISCLYEVYKQSEITYREKLNEPSISLGQKEFFKGCLNREQAGMVAFEEETNLLKLRLSGAMESLTKYRSEIFAKIKAAAVVSTLGEKELKDELDKLRVRLQELEEENQKYRQDGTSSEPRLFRPS